MIAKIEVLYTKSHHSREIPSPEHIKQRRLDRRAKRDRQLDLVACESGDPITDDYIDADERKLQAKRDLRRLIQDCTTPRHRKHSYNYGRKPVRPAREMRRDLALAA